MATSLMEEALALGAGRAQVIRDGTWYVVLADRDWLQVPSGAPPRALSPVDQFQMIVPLPEVREHWHRQEVALTVFADAVVTSDGRQTHLIRGDRNCPLLAREFAAEADWRRAVAFVWPKDSQDEGSAKR
jgi:hypothetical protein